MKKTELHLHAGKLTETVLHLNLGHFVVFWFFSFLGFFPFDETMTELLLRHHLQDWRLRTNTKIMTETLLHLNLEIFFLFFNPLSVSLMPV
jgi:hypothetical protein